MEQVTEEDLKTIEDYEDSREATIKKDEEAILRAVEALTPIIQANRAYLKYAQAKKWFKMTTQEEETTARHNALTMVIGRAINHSIEEAEKLAFEILQDVNDHHNAKKVADLLGLDLKPHEIE